MTKAATAMTSNMSALLRLIRHMLCAGVMTIVTAGCSSWIYDDLSGCPQELVFHFYRQTPCETQPYYPANVRELRVFAFNENNVLTEQYTLSDQTLRGDYRFTTRFDHQGTFTFVAWGAENFSDYHIGELQTGVTTFDQLTLSLRQQSVGQGGKLSPLYFSEQPVPLCRCNPTDMGTYSDTVSLNLQELTNRINLTVYGLDASHDYRIFIEDRNAVYDFTGQPVAGQPGIEYTSPQDRDGSVLRCRFTTLKLAEQQGTRLVVYDVTLSREVFSTLLVDDLIMYRGAFGEPPYSHECDHDFNVVLFLQRGDDSTPTYMAVQAVVNDWNVLKRIVNPY